MPRLQHAALTFPPGEDERVRAFYGGVLGLPEATLPDGLPADIGWIWFATDDPGIDLHLIPDERLPDPARRHHAALEFPDLRPVVERLTSAGVEVRAAGTPIPGRERLFCHDPFGNLLEILTFVR